MLTKTILQTSLPTPLSLFTQLLSPKPSSFDITLRLFLIYIFTPLFLRLIKLLNSIILFLLLLLQLDASLFLEIEVGQSLIVDDPDGNFTVTAFDANHCPGNFSSSNSYNQFVHLYFDSTMGDFECVWFRGDTN